MRLHAGLVALALLASAATARGQVVTENAGTLSPETPLWQTRLAYARTHHVTDLSGAETLVWAPDATLDLALTVPVHHRDVAFGGRDATREGLGDTVLRGKWSVWKVDDVMASTRVSVLAGVELPTGRWSDHEGGQRMSRKLTLGSGTWDLVGGPLFTVIRDRHRFAVEVLGRYGLPGHGFRPGPSLQVGAAYWARLAPARLETAGETTEIRGVLEVTGVVSGESREHGRGLDDQGVVLWLSPGVQVYPDTWVLFEASVQIPVWQTVDDARGNRRVGALVAIKFLF